MYRAGVYMATGNVLKITIMMYLMEYARCQPKLKNKHWWYSDMLFHTNMADIQKDPRIKTDWNTSQSLDIPQRTWAVSWQSQRREWWLGSWSWWTRWRLLGPPYLRQTWAPSGPVRYHLTRDNILHGWGNH